jgi:hypothetical protein
VSTCLNEYFIPVQVDVEKYKDLMVTFRVFWTPNINVIDPSEILYYHVEGWLPPSEYAAMLMVARGQYFLKHKRYGEAKDIFQKVWDKFPQSDFAPEALYYLGVSGYMDSHKVEDLSRGWQILQRYHPRSTWAIRSSIL